MGRTGHKKHNNARATAASFNVMAQITLYDAASDNDAPRITALLKKYPSAASSYPAQQALMDAVLSNAPDAVRALLEGGVDPNRSGREGEMVLTYAVQRNMAGIVGMLLDHGAAMDKPDSDGCTPFLLAVWSHNDATARLLAERGANVNRANDNGETPLIIAIVHDCEQMTRFLLDSGADIDPVDCDGFSARSAAQRHEDDIYVRLIDATIAKRRFEAATRLDVEAQAASQDSLRRLREHAVRRTVLKKKNPPFSP